jgi:hypothetical protein
VLVVGLAVLVLGLLLRTIEKRSRRGGQDELPYF